MYSKFIFIHCPSLITADTVIYEVSVGESARDRSYIALLQSLTQNADFYCAKYDNKVSEFLTNITESLTGDTAKSSEVPPRKQLHVSAMRRHVLQSILGFSSTQRPSRLAISQRARRVIQSKLYSHE